MKPLKTNQQVLTWLCICENETSTKLEKFAHVSFSVFVSVFLSWGDLSSMMFFIKFAAIDLEESLYALFQVAGLSGMAYLIFVVPFSRRAISATFDSLSKIYDASKKTNTKTIIEANGFGIRAVITYYMAFKTLTE